MQGIESLGPVERSPRIGANPILPAGNVLTWHQTLNRFHRFSSTFQSWIDAGIHRYAIHQNGADAALRLVAANFRARESQIAPQQIGKIAVGGNFHFTKMAVHFHGQ